jgi:hypothetical protein
MTAPSQNIHQAVANMRKREEEEPTTSLLLPTATVHHVIGDLVAVAAGAPAPQYPYVIGATGSDGTTVVNSSQIDTEEHVAEGVPISLYDVQTAEARQMHCTLPVNAVVHARIQHVPEGGDWRDIPFKEVYVAGAGAKVSSSTSPSLSHPSASQGSSVQLIQQWLVTSAKDNSDWKDCYGRLNWGGIFGTVTTDPCPTAKMGRVLHPEQDRVVTVLEVSRAQGFPDSHRLSRSLREAYKQLGNAVPPPLALAVGNEFVRAACSVFAETKGLPTADRKECQMEGTPNTAPAPQQITPDSTMVDAHVTGTSAESVAKSAAIVPTQARSFGGAMLEFGEEGEEDSDDMEQDEREELTYRSNPRLLLRKFLPKPAPLPEGEMSRFGRQCKHKGRRALTRVSSGACPICLDGMDMGVQCSSCSAVLHLHCVQRAAQNCGKQFRCPMCSCTKFAADMLQAYDVKINQKKPSWTSDSHYDFLQQHYFESIKCEVGNVPPVHMIQLSMYTDDT